MVKKLGEAYPLILYVASVLPVFFKTL